MSEDSNPMTEPTEARIEKVARAMVVVEFGDLGEKMDDWMARPEFGENYRKLARAAIAALTPAKSDGEV